MSGRGDLFLAFAAAAALHAGGLVLGFPQGGGGGAGDGGSGRLSIEAASPLVSAMLRDWERPPAVAEALAMKLPEIGTETPAAFTPETRPERSDRPIAPVAAEAHPVSPILAPNPPSRPTFASVVADMPVPVTENEVHEPLSLPVLSPPDEPRSPDISPMTPPKADFAPLVTASPAARPTPDSSPAVTRQIASGLGEAGTRGETRAAPAPSVSKASQQAAASAWAAEIQRSIARHHAYPRGSRDEGRVRVAMVILASGKLSKVSVSRSSGSPSLDKAAIAAVKQAAPFPPAPSSLNDDWFEVGQWITFEQR